MNQSAAPAGAVALALLVLLLSHCAPRDDPAATAAARADAVRQASTAWDAAHNAGDVARLMTLYAESPVSMPFNRPALEGRNAIEADFRAFFDEVAATHTTTIVALEVTGDWAIERGRYELALTPKKGGAAVKETGKHIVVRRLIDGAWKVVWEIWNTDAPAPQ